jgi:hypothetical protein
MRHDRRLWWQRRRRMLQRRHQGCASSSTRGLQLRQCVHCLGDFYPAGARERACEAACGATGPGRRAEAQAEERRGSQRVLAPPKEHAGGVPQEMQRAVQTVGADHQHRGTGRSF